MGKGMIRPAGALLVLGSLALGPCCLAQPASVAEGGRLAEDVCARCHNVTPGGGGSWTDAPSFESIANRPRMSQAWLADFVARPHMHMLQRDYTRSQVNSIAAYIMSLRRE
ncbi:MAG: hypothetical protein JOZ58_01510 [Acetobacteraceae bacterium]|nr:hypothetical protein [Acetobacteraceae bacterium]